MMSRGFAVRFGQHLIDGSHRRDSLLKAYTGGLGHEAYRLVFVLGHPELVALSRPWFFIRSSRKAAQ
jgi:hypothetical protein